VYGAKKLDLWWVHYLKRKRFIRSRSSKKRTTLRLPLNCVSHARSGEGGVGMCIGNIGVRGKEIEEGKQFMELGHFQKDKTGAKASKSNASKEDPGRIIN